MKTHRSDYYDIDVMIDEGELIKAGLIEDVFFLKDLKQRKLTVNFEIEQFGISDIVRHIFQFNKEDAGISPEERKPIILYVVSNGGEVDSGFELIDAIIASKTPVYTVNLGYQYSMGFLIGLAGHKRYAMPNAKFLMHDGSQFIYNSGAKVQDQMEFQRKVEDRVKQYIISHSRLTSEEYDSKLRVEWYLFADEAKEKGFTDYIIGVDCDLDEVI